MTAVEAPRKLFDPHPDPSAPPSWEAPSWAEAVEPAPRTLRDVLGGGDPGCDQSKLDEVYREAYDEGIKSAKAAVAKIMERYHQAVIELEMLRDRILVDSERDLIDLAVTIAREALAGEKVACEAFTEKMVEYALKLLREADTITLKVSPTDCKALRSKHPELVNEHTVVRIVEDPSLALGGVVAECSFGQVDASLTRRLAEAAQALRQGAAPAEPSVALPEEP